MDWASQFQLRKPFSAISADAQWKNAKPPEGRLTLIRGQRSPAD